MAQFFTYATFDVNRTPGQFEPTGSGTTLECRAIGASVTAHATLKKSGGIWRVEFVPYGDPHAGAGWRVGVALDASARASKLGTESGDVGWDSATGEVIKGGSVQTTTAPWGVGDVPGMVVDLEAHTAQLLLNGAPVGSVGLNADTYRLAASLWQGANDQSAAVALLLSTGAWQFEHDPTPPGVGFTAASPSMPAPGWFEPVPHVGLLRAATREYMTAAGDPQPHMRYREAIADGGLVLTDGVSFWPWGRRGRTGRPQLRLHNADGAYDALLESDARDAEVTLRTDDGATLGRYIVDTVKATDDAQVTVGMSDRAALLETALQRRLILPTADETAARQPWPWGVGAIRSAEPISTQAADRIMAVNDGPIAGIGAVRDRGAVFDASAGDYTLPPGDGVLQLAREPQGRVTLDFSTLGGDLPVQADDWMEGDGDFTDAGPWTLDHWQIQTAQARMVVSVASDNDRHKFWPATYDTRNVLAGEVYKIDVDVDQFYSNRREIAGGGLGDHARLLFCGSLANGSPDTTNPLAAIYPDGDSSFQAQGRVTRFIAPRRTGPLHVVFFTGWTLSASAFLSDMQVFHVGQDNIDDDALIPATLEHTLRQLLEVKAGLQPIAWSAADAQAIDARTGYAGVGFYADGRSPVTVAQALTLVLDAYCADYFVDEAGVLRFVQLIDPGSVTADHTIDAAELHADVQVEIDTMPAMTTQIEGRRNWSPLAASEMVSDDLGLPYFIDGGTF